LAEGAVEIELGIATRTFEQNIIGAFIARIGIAGAGG